MVRPKKGARAEQAQWLQAATKRTYKKVPVINWEYDGDHPVDGGVITTNHRPKLPPGTFYEDELSVVSSCVELRKRVHFEEARETTPMPKGMKERGELARKRHEEVEKQAVTLLKKLKKDPSAKGQKAAALAKAAGFRFTW